MTTNTVPMFRTHSAVRASLRGVALLTIASALAVGFLADVWHGPTRAELHSVSTPAAVAGVRS
jgi:hypothetical protein